ncbi:MAG TPA: TRAP transporter substrate-binding protein DctP [Ureibacillus sp.]|nr:TRAP transporter substrate-binding protein DctP [Ureibacillus sp.]
MKWSVRKGMFAVLATGVVLVAGCGGKEDATSASSGEEMTVRIAYNLPKEHAVGVFFETLAEEIEKRTENTSIKLDAQTFSDGQLYNDTQMTDAISQGGVEIGGINAGMVASESAPLLESFDMPFLFASWEAEKAAIASDYGQLIAEDFENLNVKIVGWSKYGTADVYANFPIKVPADIEKQKMRSVGKTVTEWLEDTGASPTSMSSQEVFQAMERKMIDGYVTGASSVIDRSFFEVTKYGTDMELTHTSFPAGANLEWWNGLPEDVQKAILEASEVAATASREKAYEDDQAYKQKMKDNGMELYKPTGEDLELWHETANTIHEEFAQKSDRAKQLIDSVEKINEQYPRE